MSVCHTERYTVRSTKPLKDSKSLRGFPLPQSGRPGSNRRPSAWEADALPTELLPRASQFYLRRTWGQEESRSAEPNHGRRGSSSMRCYRLFAVISVASLLAEAPPIEGQLLHYRTVSSRSDSVLWRFSVDGASVIREGVSEAVFGLPAPVRVDRGRDGLYRLVWRSESGDAHEEIHWLTPDGDSREWQISFPERDTEYRGWRARDSVGVQGVIDGDSVHVMLQLSGGRLWANPGLGLSAFAASGAEETEFWVLRLDERSLLRMHAKREAVETIEVAGEHIETVRVRWAPRGWRGWFYNRRFWFRLEDGILIRTDDRDGRRTEFVSGRDGGD